MSFFNHLISDLNIKSTSPVPSWTSAWIRRNWIRKEDIDGSRGRSLRPTSCHRPVSESKRKRKEQKSVNKESSSLALMSNQDTKMSEVRVLCLNAKENSLSTLYRLKQGESCANNTKHIAPMDKHTVHMTS